MKFKNILASFIASSFIFSALPGSVMAANSAMTIDVNNVVRETVDIGLSTDYAITEPIYKDGEVNLAFIQAFNSFKMPIVRIGEAATKKFEWKEAIGPFDSRTEQELWGVTGKVEPGPLEFIEAYEAINPDVEFTITLNMITDTAEDAADFVEFLTGDVSTEWGAKRAEYGHPAPVNVKVFELGNENDIVEGYTVDKYIADSKEFISAIEAIKPDAKFSMHADTGIYNGVKNNQSDYDDWHLAILADEVLKEKIDYISLHTYYSYTRNGLMDKIINIVEEDIKDAGKEGEIKIFISEYAGYFDAEDGAIPHDLEGVIETANIYARMMNQEAVEMMTYHGLNSSEWKHVVYNRTTNQIYLNAIGHLSKMFSEFAQGEVLSSSLTGFTEGSNSDASGLVVRDADGNINLILSNKSSRALPIDVSFSDNGNYKIKRETKIVGGNAGLQSDISLTDNSITIDTYDYITKSQISTYTVPAYSVCAIELEKAEEKKLNVIKSYDFSDLSGVSEVTGDATIGIVDGKLSVTSYTDDMATWSENTFYLTTENTNSAFNLKADINISGIADEGTSVLGILLNTDSECSSGNQVNIPLTTGSKKLEISVAEDGTISVYINDSLIQTEAGTLENASGYIGLAVTDVNFTLDNVEVSEFDEEAKITIEKPFTYEENFDDIENGRLPEGWDIMSSDIIAGAENGELVVTTRDWYTGKGIKFSNLGNVKREGLVMEADVTLIENYGKSETENYTRPKTGFFYMGEGAEQSTGGLFTFTNQAEFTEVGSSDKPTANSLSTEGFLAGEKVNLKFVFSSQTKSPDIYVNNVKTTYYNITSTTKNSGFLGLMMRACKVKFDNIKISGVQTNEYRESELTEKVVDFTYEENFDNTVDGALPTGWTVPNSGEFSAQVSNGKLVLDCKAWEDRSVLIESLGEVQREGLTMEADVKLISYDANAQSKYGQRPQAGFAYMHSDAGMSSTALLAWFPQAEIKEQGISGAQQANTHAVYGEGEGFIAKENVKIKIVFNNPTTSPEIYINGTFCNYNSKTPIANTINNSGLVGLMAGRTAKVEFDNLKITGKRLKVANKENSITVNSVKAVNGSPVITAEVKCADLQIENAMFVAAVYDKTTKALVDLKTKNFNAQEYKYVKVDFVIDTITDYSAEKYEIKIMAMDSLTLKSISDAKDF